LRVERSQTGIRVSRPGRLIRGRHVMFRLKAGVADPRHELVEMLSQLPLEVLHIMIIVDAAAMLLEPHAKSPHLVALRQGLYHEVVVVGHSRLSLPQIDQHLSAGHQRLLDFLLRARAQRIATMISASPDRRRRSTEACGDRFAGNGVLESGSSYR